MEQIQEHFPIDIITCELEPKAEVFPSQQVPALIMHNGQIRMGELTWGLVPFWTKEKKGTGHINARMESLDQKPSFRESFRKRRCLVIADGFYEWKADPEKNKKNRYHFQLPAGDLFAFAGLWDTWNKDYHGCTIVTRDAVGDLKEIHDRMPCVLQPDAYKTWLDPSMQDAQVLMDLLSCSCVGEFSVAKG
jgi:putative SOS response-associated peptidase YedK